MQLVVAQQSDKAEAAGFPVFINIFRFIFLKNIFSVYLETAKQVSSLFSGFQQ